jgi:hypothetical protein
MEILDMRSMRNTLTVAALLAGMIGRASLLGAQQQQIYPQTLYWGSGLVDIPVAWVAPVSGDFAINYAGKQLERDPNEPKINYSNRINSQLTASLSAFGRVDLGYAAYSSNPEFGFFWRALLLREEDFGQSAIARWALPSFAVGMRNIGSYGHIDRFGIGYIMLPGPNNNMQHLVDSLHQGFNTNNTFYGVATKGWSLQQLRTSWPDVDLSLSLGYGNGLFKDDGGLGARYSKHSTGGWFYGGKVDFNAAPHTVVTLMAENNAWDFNLGAGLSYRGIRAGLYLTEVGAGSASPVAGDGASTIYNYQKVSFTLGWQSNVFALLKGNFLQSRTAALERQRQGLLAEIARRQERIAQLELEINRYEAQNLLELEQRRAAAEVQLRDERDTLQRLEDRLRRIEQQVTPQPTSSQPAPKPPQK